MAYPGQQRADAVQLVAGPLTDPRFSPLIAALVAELQVRYRDEGAAGKALDPAAFDPPDGTFLAAVLAGEPVGCGGLRRHAPGVGELKRMYVAPQVRGRGVGRALLAGLEDRARELGYTSLLLETGTAQPEAVRLYTAAGWQRVEPYGEWRDSPQVRCFGKQVGPARGVDGQIGPARCVGTQVSPARGVGTQVGRARCVGPARA